MALSIAATRSLVLLLIMLMVNIGNNACHGTSRETSVLQSWKNQIQDPQASLQDWVSSDVSPCNWTGITCGGYLSQVFQIDLSNMGLSGALNPVLGQLQMLASFNISSNNFSGDLPPGICSWANLQVLGLNYNSFAGNIPSCLSQLSQLRVMDLSFNSFTGLPTSIGMFPQLSYLNVEGCALNGTIPPAISNITTLTSLSLGGNQLTGFIPPQLSQLGRLQRMHLGYNGLVGQIPSALGFMRSLKYLNLAKNNFTGTIPSTLGDLVHLEELKLFGNYLTGAIPATIGGAASIVTLDISDNSLSSRIPQEIGGIKSLEVLNLTKNELEGQIPLTLSILPGLRVVSLSLNKLTGSIPEGFGVNSNISTLDLSSNQLVDFIPHGLCSSRGLSILDLSFNFLYDSVPIDLQSCLSLQRIKVANNGLSGTLEGIGALPMLSYLDVSSNKLSGTLESAQFGNSSASLIELYLQDNQFISSLPESIGLIPNLSKLDVSRNNLSGEIPTQLGNCTKLSELILEGNNFSGSIPQEISNIKQLQVINLSWNALSGTIPVQFGSLLTMQDLDLSHNQFNGSIPVQLANCSLLDHLDLSYNNLSGPVPVTGVFQTINNISLAGNNDLCGGPAKCKLPVCAQETVSLAVKILTIVWVAMSILTFAIGFWWQGRRLGTFQDMKETTTGEAGVNRGAAAADGTTFEEREISIWDPNMESVGLQGEEEMRVFHRSAVENILPDERGERQGEEEMRVFHRGAVETILDERDEGHAAVSSPYNSPSSILSFQRWQPPNWTWKVVPLVPELDLTEEEVQHTCAPNKLIGRARSAEMYAGVTKNGLQFVVERQLRPANGENLSIVLRKLGQCRHPHIVKVLGYCLSSDNSLVAVLYEDMAGGNLSEALQSGRLSRHPHRWGCRFDIALGIVRALHYLHENQFTSATPMHYKITSSEVILDVGMKAYLSARIDVSELDHAIPESSRNSSVSEKIFSSTCTDGTDIHDLGVVLLELLSGRPVKAPNGMRIVNWFHHCLEMESTIQDMLDPMLGTRISSAALNQIGSLFSQASRCLAEKPEERPSLEDVLGYLLRISKPPAAADRTTVLRGPSRLSRSRSEAL